MVQKATIPHAWVRRRTRHDPPDVEEAVAAAQGLTDDIDSQIEIAAQLIGLSEDEVRPFMTKVPTQSRIARLAPTPSASAAGSTIRIERRGPRQISRRVQQG